jgi:ubiquinol-cytochrome c reductase iron-sulfur subunit
MLTAVYYAGVLSFARMYAIGVIGRLNGWKRYDKDTYMEMDITDLPPGEVMQIGWNVLIDIIGYSCVCKKINSRRN